MKRLNIRYLLIILTAEMSIVYFALTCIIKIAIKVHHCSLNGLKRHYKVIDMRLQSLFRTDLPSTSY